MVRGYSIKEAIFSPFYTVGLIVGASIVAFIAGVYEGVKWIQRK